MPFKYVIRERTMWGRKTFIFFLWRIQFCSPTSKYVITVSCPPFYTFFTFLSSFTLFLFTLNKGEERMVFSLSCTEMYNNWKDYKYNLWFLNQQEKKGGLRDIKLQHKGAGGRGYMDKKDGRNGLKYINKDNKSKHIKFFC